MITENPGKPINNPLFSQIMDMSAEEGNIPKAEQLPLILKAQAGDEQAMNRILISNMRICFATARRYQGRGVELLDLFNEAVIGMRRGVMSYDPSRGASLLTCAIYWVRWSLTNACAEQSRSIQLTRRQVEVWVKVRNFLRDEKAARRHPRLEDIVEAVGETTKTVRASLANAYGQDSLNVAIGEDKEEMQNCIGYIDRYADWIKESESEWLQRLISANLTEREQLVIQGYYFDNIGYVKLGEKIGRTKERARQIGIKALAKLKVAIAECGEDLTESDRVDLLGTFDEGVSK